MCCATYDISTKRGKKLFLAKRHSILFSSNCSAQPSDFETFSQVLKGNPFFKMWFTLLLAVAKYFKIYTLKRGKNDFYSASYDVG